MSLPDEPWPSSTRMARALVTYMDCPRRVRRAVLEQFNDAPGIDRIRKFREDALAQREPERGPYSLHDGYYPEDVRKTAEIANTVFLRRLERERML